MQSKMNVSENVNGRRRWRYIMHMYTRPIASKINQNRDKTREREKKKEREKARLKSMKRTNENNFRGSRP